MRHELFVEHQNVLIFFLQIDVKAVDRGTPPLTSDQTARVNVRVTRNANAPVFQGRQPFNATVNENQAPNTKIAEVKATDRDPEGVFRELTYEVIGDDNAPTYFTANDNGDILVRRNLQEAALELFSVSKNSLVEWILKLEVWLPISSYNFHIFVFLFICRFVYKLVTKALHLAVK